jgi:hypothetical protein
MPTSDSLFCRRTALLRFSIPSSRSVRLAARGALWLAVGAAALTGVSTPAQAAVVLSAASWAQVSGGVEFGNNGGINQGGLLTPYTSGVTDWTTYFAGNPLHTFERINSNPFYYKEFWVTGSTASIRFNFGTAVELSGIALWVEDAAGMQQFNLKDGSGNLLISNQTATDNPGGANYGADLYTFTQTSTSSLVLELLNNADYIAGPNNLGPTAAFGEIAFRQELSPASTGVPESAATLQLCAVGLVGIGVLARRRPREAQRAA